MIIEKNIIPFMWISILTVMIFVFFLIVLIIVFTKRKNRKEKEFLRLLIKDRERRNKRMAYELDQYIINPMSASRMVLNEIKDNKNNKDQEDIRYALEKMTLALNHVYHLDQCFNDYEIEQYGLFHAVTEEINWINKTTGINGELKIEGNKIDFPLFESFLLLRIVQDALSNSLIHANTSKISIIFHFQKDALFLLIEDWGIGFDPRLKQNQEGEGIKNMKHFAQQLKGNLEVGSAPGQGTKIQLHIPYLGQE